MTLVGTQSMQLVCRLQQPGGGSNGLVAKIGISDGEMVKVTPHRATGVCPVSFFTCPSSHHTLPHDYGHCTRAHLVTGSPLGFSNVHKLRRTRRIGCWGLIISIEGWSLPAWAHRMRGCGVPAPYTSDTTNFCRGVSTLAMYMHR